MVKDERVLVYTVEPRIEQGRNEVATLPCTTMASIPCISILSHNSLGWDL